MKKIKNFIIHALGGVTEEEKDLEFYEMAVKTRQYEMRLCRLYLESMNGKEADEWCRNAYDYVCKRIEFLKQDTEGERDAD